MFPPIVPRLRIGGPANWRHASTRAGYNVDICAFSRICDRVTRGPSRISLSLHDIVSRETCRRSSKNVGEKTLSRILSIKSVQPAITLASAPYCFFILRASSSVVGATYSGLFISIIVFSLSGLIRGKTDKCIGCYDTLPLR